jgi:uncharacterized damage-inducible protein DinB
MQTMATRTFYIDFDHPHDHAITYFLEMLDKTRSTTLRKIKNMPVEELDWQYKPGWNTIGALLSHTAALEHYFRIEFVEGRKLIPAEEEKWLPALDLGHHVPTLIRGLPVAFYQDAFAESRRLFLESFKKMDFDSFTRRIEGYDPQEGCNLAWVLYHMIEDEIRHCGQIALLHKLYNDKTERREEGEMGRGRDGEMGIII